MSKSRGNIINPDELIEKYGADALRLYEIFMGPAEQTTKASLTNLTSNNITNKEIEEAYREMVNKTTEYYQIDMKENQILKGNTGVQVAYSSTEKQPTKITGLKDPNLIKVSGTLTSRIEVKPSSDIPAYGFFKLEDKEVDIPVVFRIKDQHNN
ncbi:8415_t:CDS:2 [Ambispora leptoticha]|uniref:8415_t:CDS:1 n=1 Tax=Ambispora leptoticha TaxID=144679 RepID=A0A9N8YPG9_9GLOM|nr:8415_t:CDS:2 [Ambispora leptoticha]